VPILNIKDPEAHALAVELAKRTGQSLTQAVKEALRESLRRKRSTGASDRLVARVLELGRRASSRPVLDPRSADEILGYHEHGVPRS
jgi:antitoxin VapB